jgi:hypothetical protein
MKYKISSLFINATLLILTSCTPGIYQHLGRPLEDPGITEPEAASFERELTVTITWDVDKRCDEYILYRRLDSAFSIDEIVYRGTETEYMDTNGVNEDRYLYSLSKIRGQQEFGPSEPAFGVFSYTIQDFLEPNNSKADAVWLEFEFASNMYYYRNADGDEVLDVDWFYVEVPPRRIATIVVCQTGLTNEDTFFNFSQVGEVPFQVKNNNDIPIENRSTDKDRFYFKLYPVPSEFLNDISEAGGSIVEYTISLIMITSL